MNLRSPKLSTVFFLTGMLCLLAGSASAVPPSPEAKAKFKAEGTWDQKVADLMAFDDAQDPSMNHDALEQHLSYFHPAMRNATALAAEPSDTVHIIVLLVEFPDFSHTSTSYSGGGTTVNCYYAAEPSDFDSLLFSRRDIDAINNPTGSWTDFYLENSYGEYLIKGDVYGWYMMPNNYSYYVGENSGLGGGGSELASDACVAANDDVDFSLYAQGSTVPGIVVVHAGPGAEQGAYGIWSHRSNMSPSHYFDQVNLSGYTMQPEEQAYTSGLVHMGVFCHEWGHVMGLPDFYDPSYASEGIGDWCVMAGGSWNNGGRQPAHFNCYAKYQLGFNDMQWIDQNVLNAPIEQSVTSKVAYALRDNTVAGEGSTNIWFVENRQQVGFDQYLPGNGLIIYHLDGTGTQTTPQDAEVHLFLAVEEADGRMDMINKSNGGDSGDPFPGSTNNRFFHDYTNPSSTNGDGTQSQVSVLNVSNSDSLMTADLGVIWALPWPELIDDSLTVDDSNGGNGNGIVEQGETVDVYLEVTNRMRTTFNPRLTLEVSDPGLIVTDNNQGMPIQFGHLTNCQNFLPIHVTVPDDFISSVVTFTFSITSDSLYALHDNSFVNTVELQVPIGKSQILVVDDDNGRADDRRMTNCLDRLGYRYEVYNKYTAGSPTSTTLNEYPFVFWMTGSYSPPGTPGSDLTTDDIDAMRGFMDAGGNLLVGSYSMAYQLDEMDSVFMDNYFKATLLGSISQAYFLGVEGSPLADGIMVFGDRNGVVWNGATPTLEVADGGQAAFIITNSSGAYMGDVCGVTYDGSYRSVFLSFGAEMTISQPSEYYDFVITDTLVKRIATFFARGSATPVEEDGGENLLPTDFALDQNYPNPFNPSTQISYSIGSGLPANTSLDVFNVLGQKVATLVNEVQGIGHYTAEWDGESYSGAKVASGVYFYRLTHGEMSQTKKMILMK